MSGDEERREEAVRRALLDLITRLARAVVDGLRPPEASGPNLGPDATSGTGPPKGSPRR